MRLKFLVRTVKKFLQSVHIYESYRKIKTGVSLFGPPGSVVRNVFLFSIVPSGGVKMMPCEDGEERQGWKRDLQRSQIVAATTHFGHRRVLAIKCQSLHSNNSGI